MTLPEFKKPLANRSSNMRAIRSTGNKTTEKKLVALLRGARLRGWSLHPKNVLGNPDLMIKDKHVAVFVDGCFWHGCPRCGHIPHVNKSYWTAKITQNKRRDATTSRALRRAGFRVIRLRECQLRSYPDRCLRRILRAAAA
jgi:DNA mismatch endonuclease (patch repair protein)